MTSFQLRPEYLMVSEPDAYRVPLVHCLYLTEARPDCAVASRDALATRWTIAAVSTTGRDEPATFPPARAGVPWLPPVAATTAAATAAAATGAATAPDRIVSERRAWRRCSVASRSG